MSKRAGERSSTHPNPASAHRAPPPLWPRPVEMGASHGRSELCLLGAWGAPGPGTNFLHAKLPACGWCVCAPLTLDSSAADMSLSVQNSLLCCRNDVGQRSQKNCLEGRGNAGMVLWAQRAEQGPWAQYRGGLSPMTYLFHWQPLSHVKFRGARPRYPERQGQGLAQLYLTTGFFLGLG